MEIQQLNRSGRLANVAGDLLGFDLEMANSFRDAAPVVCMIGLEYYDPGREACIATIGSITRRDEEPDLVRWFLDYLRKFAQGRDRPRLVTFSGTDNDLPWIRERIERYRIEPSLAAALDAFEELDLRVAFHRRTQNNQISLKKLEELFGIERDSSLSSRKVSYLLTDVLTRDGDRDIPDRIYDYLGEDVHNLLVILDRWDDHSLAPHNLTEYEYLNTVVGLLKHARKLHSAPPSRLSGRHTAPLGGFASELTVRLEAAIRAETFEEFTLPSLPAIEATHPELERLARRHQRLSAIETVDAASQAYRLARQLAGPKGTLALVRRNGRVLMIRRADELERAPGYWGLPGGVLEKGESPAAGAVRELKEELNLRGEPVQLMGTQPSMNRAYELFWVEVAVEDVSHLRPRVDEVAEARWVAPQELEALDPIIPGAMQWFRHFLGPNWAPARPKQGGGGRRR